MSVEAITWALRQPVPASSAKFVLVVLANCASADTGVAYPSIAYIAEATGQDRKTVVSNLRRLVEWGLIDDTGDRAGRTKQVIVYRMNCGPSLFESGPKTGPLQTRKSTPKTERFQKRNGSVSTSKEYRFSPETVPKTGHGTVNNHQEPIPRSPACADAGDDGLPPLIVTDGDGHPVTSAIAALTAGQSAHLVKACRALRKMGSLQFNSGDDRVAAIFREQFTAEQTVRVVGEKSLRDAGLWNDPDVREDIFDLLINGATQRDMGLTDKQYAALRSAISQVSAGYVAATLRGRRRDTANQQPGARIGHARTSGPVAAGKVSAVERVKAANAAAEQRDREHAAGA